MLQEPHGPINLTYVSIRSLLLPFATALSTGAALTSVQAQNSPGQPVIIAIRHGEDADVWGNASIDPQHGGNPPDSLPFLSKYWSSVNGQWPEYLHKYTVIGDASTPTEGKFEWQESHPSEKKRPEINAAK